MAKPSPEIILKCRNIHLSYGETQALRGVDFDLAKGEIHALVGEHRAGKSSLMKLLSGAERCKQGEIIYKGKQIPYFTPSSAIKHGIAIVYQELSVIHDLNAIENIYNGHMIRTIIRTPAYRKMYENTMSTLKELDFEVDCRKPLVNLSRSQQHLVEFARAYTIKPEVLLLDEISNKLTPEEMQKVYRSILKMKEQGVAIVYISHDIDEILRISDRITILKDGLRRGTEYTRNLDKFRLYQLTYSFSLDRQQVQNAQIEFYLFLQHLESIINNLNTGIVLLDSNATIKMINLVASDILALNPDEIINASLDFFLDMFQQKERNQIKRAFTESRPTKLDSVVLSSGNSVDIQIIPVSDSPGRKKIAITVLLEDKTAEKELTDYLIKSEKMSSVASVAVGIAHEINNPLAIIRNYIDIINDTGTSEDVSESIHKVEVELDRIVDIVSSLLSFSRIKQAPKELVNLNSQIESIFPLINHMLLEKNIIVHTSLPKQSVYIHFSENKLKQVLLNIISNSIDALLDKGQIWVELVLDEEEKNAVIIIKDNGYGIPIEVTEKIFNPFFTTKITSKNTGLGLTICKHIVEAYNGIIEFQSEPGSYTSFSVTLPLP